MKRSLFSAVLPLIAAFMPLISISTAEGQATIRLHGATSIAKVLQPKIAELESKHGVKLEVVGNSSGRGLEALMAGKADIAMLAGALDLNAANLNAEKPGSVDASKLKDFIVFTENAIPVVNPANAVESLTAEQVKGILTGKIKNWKEVGGAELPIVVVLPPPSDGTRQTVKARILGDEQFAADARIMQSSPDLNRVIPQLPGGIAIMSASNKAPTLKTIKCAAYTPVTKSLVTIGEPSEKTKALMAAIAEICK